MLTSAQIITEFNLSAHPEGGHYRRTYCSDEMLPKSALPSRFTCDHPISSAILYLLRSGEYARLHRIRQDECWHFYTGSPLRIVMISPDNNTPIQRQIHLGTDFRAGQTPQAIVPAGWWFGATPIEPSSYTLVGCTVAPAFLFDDWELGTRARLLNDYPIFQSLIFEFTTADSDTQTATPDG